MSQGAPKTGAPSGEDPAPGNPRLALDPEQLRWSGEGLIPAIVQHARTRKVLMLAYMNRDSLARTLQGEHVWFWSRTRQELWEKGATSNNYLIPKQLVPDCDGDTLLVLAEPTGPVCHTGEADCFYQGDLPPGSEVLEELAVTIAQRNRDRPEGSYTAKLLSEGIDRIVKKVGEEAAEVIIAGKNGSREEIVWEVGDLLYHTLVLLEASGVPLDAIYAELVKRRR
jgi:phosphoribosyl-ATP pyrophosphohydrolase/phosphoribosyl-AMP cyclohydrolase